MWAVSGSTHQIERGQIQWTCICRSGCTAVHGSPNERFEWAVHNSRSQSVFCIFFNTQVEWQWWWWLHQRTAHLQHRFRVVWTWDTTYVQFYYFLLLFHLNVICNVVVYIIPVPFSFPDRNISIICHCWSLQLSTSAFSTSNLLDFWQILLLRTTNYWLSTMRKWLNLKT